jgi:hypothetical protein
MHDLVNYSKIIKRVKEKEGLRFDKELASLLELSKSDFNNRKKRGTLLELLINHGMTKEWNLDWLIKGDEIDTLYTDRIIRDKIEHDFKESSPKIDDVNISMDKQNLEIAKDYIEHLKHELDLRDKKIAELEEKLSCSLKKTLGDRQQSGSA